jgi:hypothetical protein
VGRNPSTTGASGVVTSTKEVPSEQHAMAYSLPLASVQPLYTRAMDITNSSNTLSTLTTPLHHTVTQVRLYTYIHLQILNNLTPSHSSSLTLLLSYSLTPSLPHIHTRYQTHDEWWSQGQCGTRRHPSRCSCSHTRPHVRPHTRRPRTKQWCP